MLKICKSISKTNINVLYINKMLSHNNFKEGNFANIKIKNDYRDIHYSSCKTCSGSGFIKNLLYDIYKLEKCETKNKDNLEDEYLEPHKICTSCHGTGKNDYNAVFFYTCCQKQ